ncbi:hypothetical protein ABZU45_28045 [Streptomyces avermitilis]|uniref:hypothetical protein n=1 Tax=Streptomyces avermitilis TaxID=33903 RepID=UPI0033B09312
MRPSIALRQQPAFRNVQTNSARTVDEWLPIKGWSTEAVKEWHTTVPVPYSWTYDSVPGSGDWAGTSPVRLRLAPRPAALDGRRPRLSDLYAEVEQVRDDSLRADWRISDLIRHARTCEAPDPGVVCADDGPDFAALQAQVRGALKLEPRKEPDLARKRRRRLCNGCAALS